MLKINKLVWGSVLVVGVFSQPAYAYLDPGTGSILIQSLIAALAAGAYALKTYWYRIKGFFDKSAEQTVELREVVESKQREDLDQS